MPIYLIPNGPMQTTAQFAGVTTGTSIKTMLQYKASATAMGTIIGWGCSWSGHASNTGLTIELIETDVAATVTASATADITRWDGDALTGGDPVTNLIPVGTTSTGYTSGGEGSTTAIRNLDLPLYVYAVQPGSYNWQYPLGREPRVQISKFARVRVLATGNAVDFKCYLLVQV